MVPLLHVQGYINLPVFDGLQRFNNKHRIPVWNAM